MTTLTEGIEKIMERSKTIWGKIAAVKSKLSTAEKVLIAIAYAVVFLCVIFPGIFWVISALALAIIVLDRTISKKNSEPAPAPSTTTEA